MPRPSRRSPIAGVCVASLLLAIGLLSAGPAQAAPLPTITLSLTKTSITVGGTLQSGGVNVVTTATGTKEAGAILFLLKPGATFEQVEAAIKAAHGDTNVTSRYGVDRVQHRSDSG